MATGTTVFSRVTVVAPRTRIDVALPSDVSVADMMPMLLEMAREATPDGGARHGGWCLAKLGGAALDPARALASLGIVDGDLLQLRKRSDNPPPPLYDDVVDAIAAATPDSYRPWTTQTANRIGHLAGGLALILAAVAALLAGPLGGGSSLVPAIATGVLTLLCVGVGAALARTYGVPATGVVVAAAGGLPMAFVCGLYIVPGGPGRPNLLLASVLVFIVAAACVWLVGHGFTAFVAAGAAAVLGVIAFLIATLIAHPAAGIAAGAAAVSLAVVSLLPRVTIQLARLPLPNVPNNAEDLRDDGGFPDYTQIEHRTGVAHEYMTGLIIGCGGVAAVSAVIAASAGTFGVILAVVVTLVLLMRARTYANGSQAIALLATGLLAALGLAVGMIVTSTPADRLLYLFGILVILGAAALVVGVLFPEQRFSPPLRRTADIIEAILIAAVLPLALAVLNLYGIVRHLHIG
ncbi:MAG: type VII secretion integral membrane protein EccD [Sciscionella sp.]